MATINYTIKDVEKVVQGIDGEVKKVDVSRLTAPGENYLSLVFRVDFEVEKDGQTKTVNTVAKCLPRVERKGFDFNGFAMKNEIRWYSEMVPLLKEFGNEFGIDTEFYPEFLGARYSLDSEKTTPDDDAVLLLKNLIPEGYKNEDRYIGFDLTSTKALLRVLATFHATPLTIKFKKPELFKTIKEYLDSCHMQPPPDKKEGDEKGKGPPKPDKLINIMLEIPACKPYKANLEALKQKPSDPSAWHKPGTEPWNTVIHSDYWLNNVMVKPIQGQEPLVKVVDFQFSAYTSYAKDLVFFMLTSVMDDVQKNNFDELLRYYYEQLIAIPERLEIPELKLCYEDFLAEVKRVALQSEIGHVFFFTSVVFGEKGTGPDILTGEMDMFEHMDYLIENISDTGEMDMFEHMDYLIENISDRQKEKLVLLTELAVQHGWL